MKNKKRMCLILISCALVFTLAFAALAEGKLLAIWNAGSKLLFETDNVSLTGHATFTYDGEVFKVFDGRYRQDDASSYMQVMLDTPDENGGFTTSGYTVVGNNGVSYSIETQQPQYYVTSSTSSAPSILTNTVMRASIMRFGGLLLDLMEERMADAITQTETDTGTEYRITLAPGQTPEIAGAAMTMLLQLYAREYLYMYSFDSSDIENSAPVDYTFTDNYDVLFAAEYEKAFGEPLPEDFYSAFYDENGNETVYLNRYYTVCQTIDTIINQAAEAYAEGVAVIENDGSITHYDTYDQYLIAQGDEQLYFEDYTASLLYWYEKQAGTALTKDELRAIRGSTNPELYEAYSELVYSMYDHYRAAARQGGYSGVMVYPDGTFKGYNDVRILEKQQQLNDMTITRRILYTLRDMQVDTADITVKMDKEGRIEDVTGLLSFATTDSLGETHNLSIDFTGTAYDYGKSEVEPFDPESYGVVSNREFFSGNYSVNDVNVPEPAVTPEPITHVTFLGTEYEVSPEIEHN